MTIPTMTRKALGPGKYSDNVCEWLHTQSMDGCDDECGSVSECGEWFGLLNIAARIDGERFVGFIIREDDMGFVEYDGYADIAELANEWNRIMDAVNADCDDSADCDDYVQYVEMCDIVGCDDCQ